METIAPEHGFWNGQTPVSGVPGGDLVSVRFLERFRWQVRLPLSFEEWQLSIAEELRSTF
jgi:hypothetical protein